MNDSVSSPAADPVLTTRAAANILGVSVSTAQLWIENGEIESWKTPGGHRRVRLSAVMKLLARQRPEQAARGTAASTPSSHVALDEEFQALATPGYPVPPDEAQRLRALAGTGLVDSPSEDVFDRLTWLATQITGASMALVSLLTATRQWFKSRVGVDAGETPREWAFCSHAILEQGPLIVEDAHTDARFRDNPLVTGEPHLRFYAGFPITSRDGSRVGTLCVLDSEPRRLQQMQLRALRELACIASEEIARRG